MPSVVVAEKLAISKEGGRPVICHYWLWLHRWDFCSQCYRCPEQGKGRFRRRQVLRSLYLYYSSLPMFLSSLVLWEDPCLLHVKLCVTSNISGKEYSLLLSPPVLKFYSPLPYIWSSVSDYHSSISPYPQTTIPGTYLYIREQVRSKYKLNDQREPLPEALGLILSTWKTDAGISQIKNWRILTWSTRSRTENWMGVVEGNNIC